MPSLKDLKNRISSIITTSQVTNAMKMISAAKLKKTQNFTINFRPYVNKLQEILDNIILSIPENTQLPIINPQTDETIKKTNKILLVLITSNKGLCGSFNNNIIRKTQEILNTTYLKKNIDFCSIGKKGYLFLKKNHYNVIYYNEDLIKNINYQEAFKFADYLINLFVKNEYKEIAIIYSSFKSTSLQIPKFEIYLPYELKKSNKNHYTNYIFEPQPNLILNELIPKILKTKIYMIILDSITAEHAARMVAMHKATDNAIELAKELRLTYNKARQTYITKEILDIIGGANALKK